ncbi:MAG: acetyl-CoA carboxylase biotin carboxyl carrier protein subunit [Planctomycetota bacterium]|nr:acetyl-CoA carboxylase biotin carboxyl carrier protein subunit [Planctomycetota bacterium]
MSDEYVVRSVEEGPGRARVLKLTPLGELGVQGVSGKPRALRVLRRDPDGLLVALWGDEVVHGIVRGRGGELELLADGKPERVSLKSAAVDAMEQAVAGAAAAGGILEVKSPIPGLIKKVTVQPGGAVEAGQTVVVLEAMKMENEIPAPHAGTVEAVAVQAGQTVNAGAVLVKIAT